MVRGRNKNDDDCVRGMTQKPIIGEQSAPSARGAVNSAEKWEGLVTWQLCKWEGPKIIWGIHGPEILLQIGKQ